jgi:hypothetical protein
LGTTPYEESPNVPDVTNHLTGPTIGPGEAVLAVQTVLRELCEGGRSAFLDDVLGIAKVRGIERDRTKGILRRMKQEGEVWEPIAGTFRLTESVR